MKKKFGKEEKLSIVAIALISALFFSGPLIRNGGQKKAKQYVENNLTKIIEAQNKKLEIEHFGVPEIQFGLYVYPSGKVLNDPGAYHSGNDKIYMDPKIPWTTPNNGFMNFLTGFFNFGYVAPIKPVLDHELGHFYQDKLNESLGMGDFRVDYSSYKTFLGGKIIAEGIAEYFSKTMNNIEDNFNDSDWPKDHELFTFDDIYDGGAHLVKPIIEKYGKDGMEYLIMNPPITEKELENLPEYRKRCLEDIAMIIKYKK